MTKIGLSKRPKLTKTVVVGCLLLIGIKFPSANAADFPRTTVFERGLDGYKIFRIPAIVQAANGDLLAFCEARMGGDASEIDLVSKRSIDGGRTWKALHVVQDDQSFRDLYPDDQTEITVGNPAPVVDLMDPKFPGRIWLPFTVENDRVFVSHSDDHGITWEKPREITSAVKKPDWGWYATGPVHSIQLQHGRHQGRLVVPADHRLGDDGADRGLEGAQAILSDDHGITWRLGAIDNTYEDDLKANETSVVELGDGRLYFNTRDQNGNAKGTRGAAYSHDGGNSFAPSTSEFYKWFVPQDAIFDPPVVQCSLYRMSKQAGDAIDLVLFAGPDENGPTGKGRSDLRLRLSSDETESWQDGPLIYEGPAAYSDIVRIEPDHIGILHEAGNKQPYERIDFVRVTTDDLNVD